MEDPTEVERKRKHNESEIRRRCRVNSCFEDLRDILAGRLDPAASRAQIIAATVDAVKDADLRVARLEKHVDYIIKHNSAQKAAASSPTLLQLPIYLQPQQQKHLVPWIATQCLFCEGKLCEFAEEISNALSGKLPPPPPSLSTSFEDAGFATLSVEVSAKSSDDSSSSVAAPTPVSGSKRKNSISGKPTDKRLPKRRNSTGDIASSVQLLPIPSLLNGGAAASIASSLPPAGFGANLGIDPASSPSVSSVLSSGPDFADILTKSTVPMCFVSPTGQFLFWNDSFASILWGDAECFKFSKGGYVYKNMKIFEFMDAASQQEVVSVFDKVLKSQPGQIYDESGFVAEVSFSSPISSSGMRKRQVTASVSFALSRKESKPDQQHNHEVDTNGGDKVLCIVHQIISATQD